MAARRRTIFSPATGTTPDTSGQGFIFDFSPSINNVFAAWYTFAHTGQRIGGPLSQSWFTLQSAQFVPA